MKKSIKNYTNLFIYTAFGAGILILICMLLFIYSHVNVEKFSSRVSDTYKILTPEECDIISDDSTPIGMYNELTLSIDSVPKEGAYLIFNMKHQAVDVYIGSELVYSLSPDSSSFIRTTGANWCSIPIYQEDSGSTVRVILTPLYKSMASTYPTFYLGSELKIHQHLLAPNIIIYIISFAAIVCGVFFIIYTLINLNNKHVNKNLIMIGMFSILIGIWKIMDLDYTALILKNPVVISYTAYFSLLMFTIPFISFLRTSFRDSDNFLWTIPCICNIAAFIILMVLQVNAIMDFRVGLWIIHVAMLSNIPVVFIMFYTEVTKYGWSKKLTLAFICSCACLIGLLADIIAYYLTNGIFPSFLGIGCLLFYIIALGITSLKEARHLMAIGSQAKDFEEMAYHDQLTGLFNRTAYAKYINSKTFQPDGHIVVMFDLNNLKKCNDNLGHEQGDVYIMESARMIEKAFAPFGNCYRMGGDEFCALLHNIPVAKCADCADALRDLITTYNAAHPDNFPLNIALGYELYDPDEDYDIGDTLRRADKMMYSEKFEMKKKNHETVR